MSRPRFFVSPDHIAEGKVEIIGEDVRHIKDVLRLKVGDVITVCDGRGLECLGRIVGVSDSRVEARVLERRFIEDAGPHITLFQGIPKGTKMDSIVQKSTELGVSRIVPVMTERTVVRLDERKRESKVSRWRRVTLEAAKQSQRLTAPEITEVVSWERALELLLEFDLVLVFWEEEKERSVRQILQGIHPKSIAVVIGPEGGFSEGEVRALKDIGGKLATLGKYILRTETASPVALAIVLYELST
ncbi:MAG TPA: 16S rRNA methyltransferase [Actinobacteria bacterium]|nr:16S rRNA methyltransferase [Actinomycetota bacterium]